MAIPLFLLSILSIFIGSITKDFFIGVGSSGILSSGVEKNHYINFDIELISTQFGIQFYPLFASLLGIIIAILILKNPNNNTYKSLFPTQLTVKITRFFNQRYWFDNIYNSFFISNTLHFGNIFSYLIDKGFLSLLGPQGLQQLLITISKFFAIKFDTGFIPHYSLLILLSTIFILISILSDI